MIIKSFFNYFHKIFLFLGLSLGLQSQTLQIFEDSLRIGSYKGKATYQYQLFKKDTIRKGAFEWERFNLKDVLETKDLSFFVNGNFKNNVPEGLWKFQFNTFQSSKRNRIKDNRYVINVKGTQSVAQGNLVNGKNNGTWTYTDQLIRDSEVDQITFKSSIEYEQGVPKKSFRIENQNSALVGRLLRNGLAHDQWTLYSDKELDIIETWTFNEGMLEEIKFATGEKVQLANSKSITKGNTRTVTLDQNYLEYLMLSCSENGIEFNSKSSLKDLLTQQVIHYKRIDSLIGYWTSGSSIQGFQVRVPHYPLSTSVKRRLDLISKYYHQSHKIEQELKTNSKLTILKLSDSETGTLETTVNKISEHILEPLKKVVNLYDSKLVTFMPVEDIITQVWSKNSIALKQLIKNSSVINLNSADITSIKEIEQLSEQTLEQLKQIQKKLNQKVNQQKQQNKALSLEEEMVAQLQLIENYKNEAVNDSISNTLIAALDTVHKFATSQLSAYGAMKDVSKKVAFANSLEVCFVQLRKMSQTIKDIPEFKNKILNDYQDDIWNPFTATLMNSVVKKRITMAYTDILLPYFVDQVKTKLDCNMTNLWLTTVDQTHTRLSEMITEDTHKIERKLKREKSPKMILEHFGVSTPNQEKNK